MFPSIPRTHKINEPVCLYRLWNDEGELLYVGITNCPAARFVEHEASKAWWREVVAHDMEWFPNRVAALDAEDAAIWLEDPIHNKDRPLPAKPRPHVRRRDLDFVRASLGSILDDMGMPSL